MSLINYLDLIVNVEVISKLFFIVYLLFIKSSFFLYFILVLLCQFNVYVYFMAYNLFSSILVLIHLLNIEFTFIQYFHILLKLLKVYVYVYVLFTLFNKVRVFNNTKSTNILLFFVLVYLYLLTGSFWSWMEPSWTSWWFGEDVEEMLIFIICLNFIVLLHYLSVYYFIKNLLLYSLLLLLLGYISNLVVFTSRHKSLTYYSIVNLNIWLVFFIFSFKLTKLNYFWYIFDFYWRYNWLFFNILSKNLNKTNQFYIYMFDVFFFYTYVIYESPIFFKFISSYVNFYFFIPNITNNDYIYILILSFFSLVAKIKLFSFNLVFVFDWDIFLNNVLFLNSLLNWNFHFFFFYIYTINLSLNFTLPINYNPSLILSIVNNSYTTYLSIFDFNSIWIFYDNILNVDSLQLIIGKDLLYFFFIFSLVFFLSWRLI